MDKKTYGSIGERAAAEYLETDGYRILDMNYTTPIAELDLIVEKGGVIAFVEVKRRKSDKYGTPAEAVTKRKQYKISQAAMYYINAHRFHNRPMRFDVVEVTDEGVNHIEDAFYSPIRY